MAFYNVAGKKECRRNHLFPLLLMLLLASGVLSVCCISPLEPEERISIRRGAYLFTMGLVFFTSLFNATNHLILRTHAGLRFKKKYHLTVQDALDIANKLVSTVQALLCTLTGLIVLSYSCPRSLLRTSHYVSEAYAWFGAAYFFYDVWSMYRVHAANISNRKASTQGVGFLAYLRAQPMIVAHHAFIGSFGFLVIVYLRGGLGDCVFGYVYLMELSTPFVCLRGVLSRLGLKTSRLYVLNGLLMLATFFLCRVAMFPYVIYVYAQQVQFTYLQAIVSLPRGCKVGILILSIPQMYWFWLMLKGAGQVFCSPKSSVTHAQTVSKRRRGNHNHNHANS